MTVPNIVLITVDDMNWDAIGACGCPTADTTPHIDALVRSGIWFKHGHVTIAVCQPSRSVVMTGRYPHRNTGEGFHHLRDRSVPILPELLREAGYQVGILGKLGHSTPHEHFQWDMAYDMQHLGMGRNPAAYEQHADAFIAHASQQDKPFFLMFNSHDPHRPFVGNDHKEWYTNKVPPAVPPSRTFSPNEVTVPGFLPDLPDVRQEIAEYYSSVRRCDDTIGSCMRVLEQHGISDNTMVIFLSDNGMAFPFAKTNCYLNSTRTPLIIRWPSQFGSRIEENSMASGIDLMPTILAAAGVTCPAGVDGRNLLPVLRGETTGSQMVYTQFHQTAGKKNFPMRAVQTKEYGYIWNPWSNGSRTFRNESMSGRCFEAMRTAAATDASIAGRVDLFLTRYKEELYHFAEDPNALVNLADDPQYAEVLADMRAHLQTWIHDTQDFAAPFCAKPQDDIHCEQLMAVQQERLQGKN